MSRSSSEFSLIRWLLPAAFTLAGIQLLKLHVEIEPIIALYPGQTITVKVTDRNSSLPIQMARIELSWDSKLIDTLYTDVQGKVTFVYRDARMVM